MKALITGGAGFIGSHLARSLCEANCEVVVVDDLSSGSLANLAWATPSDRVEFVQGSILDAELLRPLISRVDVVFHLAAETSFGKDRSTLPKSHAVNLDATLNLLLLAREAQVERFIFASTAAVYGAGNQSPCDEHTRPVSTAPYVLQKLAAESYARIFSEVDHLPTVSLRLSNVFGPAQSCSSPYTGAVAQYCTAFIHHEKPIIMGGGAQCADFIYIDDAVHAFELAATAPIASVQGRTFNVGSGRSVSVFDLLSILKELTGKELSADFLPASDGHVWCGPLDISAAATLLGFKPEIGLFQGVWETFNYYQELSDTIPAI
jgi:nucleoside-diphosphate-sugar epimerase